MADDQVFAARPVHFEGGAEEEAGAGPWGWGPAGRGPWGHRRHGPWGRHGPFGGWFGRGFGPGFGPGFGGPFGGFGREGGPEWEGLMRVGFDVVRLVQAGLLASGSDTARLAQLRSILEHTRDELNAFVGQPKPGAGQSAGTGGAPRGETSGQVL